MQIQDFLSPLCTLVGVQGSSKKRILQNIADHIATLHPELDADDLFDNLFERERLGSTGVGDGVALPHCRIDGCKGTIGMLIRLQQPVDFDAIDNQPVDLVFALMVPADAVDEHLKTLQTIAQQFSQPAFRERLRAMLDNDQLYWAATNPL